MKKPMRNRSKDRMITTHTTKDSPTRRVNNPCMKTCLSYDTCEFKRDYTVDCLLYQRKEDRRTP